jgi:predicted nucleic acid-binding protein
MSVLVFDSSAALKWFLPELYADKAKQMRDEYRKGITETRFITGDLPFSF